MARKHRLEYLRRKKAREIAKQQEIETEEKKSETNVVKEILGWIIYIAIIIAVTYLIVTYVGQRTMVSGDSMYPTLHDKDNLIVDKISYRFRDPERFEIIVFPYKYQEDTYYIKRIIGLPGDTIQMKQDENGVFMYVNGERLEESYINYEEGGMEFAYAGLAENPITLGEDEYFVLGDNRNHSSDSRDSNVGVLKREDLIGRAWVRVWPFESIGVIPHE